MSETRYCSECNRKTVSGDSYGRAYCRECGSFYEPKLLAKRKEMIAEIRKWHDGEIENFPPITVFEAVGVMLDELAEERAAHNAHVTELCELEQETRKLRERLKEEIVWQDECLKLEEQLQSAHQEIERLREHVSRAWKACWKVAGDDTELEQKLIECLQWYADTQNYKYPTVGGAGAKRPIDYDRGERARDILREIGAEVMQHESR